MKFGTRSNNSMSTEPERLGPKINVEFLCNGCIYHIIEQDKNVALKYNACSHPRVLEEYSCTQWINNAIDNVNVKTPLHLCPIVMADQRLHSLSAFIKQS
jgi:hypothetical protein